MAKSIVESDCHPAHVQFIVWNEVFAVPNQGLKSVAGDWAGWSDEWLLH
ncbi:DUF7079 family protein [Pseudomonas viridiflava]